MSKNITIQPILGDTRDFPTIAIEDKIDIPDEVTLKVSQVNDTDFYFCIWKYKLPNGNHQTNCWNMRRREKHFSSMVAPTKWIPADRLPEVIAPKASDTVKHKLIALLLEKVPCCD